MYFLLWGPVRLVLSYWSWVRLFRYTETMWVCREKSKFAVKERVCCDPMGHCTLPPRSSAKARLNHVSVIWPNYFGCKVSGLQHNTFTMPIPQLWKPCFHFDAFFKMPSWESPEKAYLSLVLFMLCFRCFVWPEDPSQQFLKESSVRLLLVKVRTNFQWEEFKYFLSPSCTSIEQG